MQFTPGVDNLKREPLDLKAESLERHGQDRVGSKGARTLTQSSVKQKN